MQHTEQPHAPGSRPRQHDASPSQPGQRPEAAQLQEPAAGTRGDNDSIYRRQKRRMREMAKDELPRELALSHGVQALSNAQLLATLLGTGQPGVPIVEICANILADNDNKLYRLSRRSLSQLTHYPGIGQVKAINILAALELGRRMGLEEFAEPPVINSSDTAARYLRNILANLDHERLIILILDHAKHLVEHCTISDGGTAYTVADVKLIMRTALEHKASSIILAHNHPSNTPRPSRQDDDLTEKVAKAAKIIEVPLIDHIIITQGGHYSYLDEGRL